MSKRTCRRPGHGNTAERRRRQGRAWKEVKIPGVVLGKRLWVPNGSAVRIGKAVITIGQKP